MKYPNRDRRTKPFSGRPVTILLLALCLIMVLCASAFALTEADIDKENLMSISSPVSGGHYALVDGIIPVTITPKKFYYSRWGTDYPSYIQWSALLDGQEVITKTHNYSQKQGDMFIYGNYFYCYGVGQAIRDGFTPDKAGTYTIRIKWWDYYNETGMKDKIFKEFTITVGAKDISECEADAIGDQAYTGAAIEPEVRIKSGKEQDGEPVYLVAGTDYTVVYENNVNAGEAKAIVTGIGSYSDTQTVPFKILPSDISGCTVSGMTDKVYTGKQVQQNPTVMNGGTKLTAGTDYTLAYENNIYVGTATCIITGTGNYTGSITETFSILPKGTSLTKVTGEQKAFTAKWKKVAKGITGYELQYATDKKFTKGAKTIRIKNAKTTSQQVKKLKGGKTYYVRIRTYTDAGGATYYSEWSKALKVKVQK